MDNLILKVTFIQHCRKYLIVPAESEICFPLPTVLGLSFGIWCKFGMKQLIPSLHPPAQHRPPTSPLSPRLPPPSSASLHPPQTWGFWLIVWPPLVLHFAQSHAATVRCVRCFATFGKLKRCSPRKNKSKVWGGEKIWPGDVIKNYQPVCFPVWF